MVNSGTTDEEVLKAIRDHRSPAVGTSDIAELVGVSRQAVDARLRDLETDGLVESDKVGRVRIWWLSNAGKRYLEKD
jgi:Mn-dependent DtxR family transcriptional regulator